MEAQGVGRGERWWSRGIPLGSPFGVSLWLNPTWLLLAALVTFAFGQTVLASGGSAIPTAIGYGIGFGFALCLVASVLLHEVGHAVCSRRFGIGVRGITLEALGGYTEMERDAPTPRIEAIISVAGPLVSLLVGIGWWVLAALAGDGTVGNHLFGELAYLNLLLAGFNALPGLPLDGGRVLQAVVWRIRGSRAAGQLAAGTAGRVIAVGTAAISGLLYLGQRISAIGLVLLLMVVLSIWSGAVAEVRAARVGQLLEGVDLRALVRPVLGVSQGTSLLAAAQRVAQAGLVDPVVAVADDSGQVVGLVHPHAAASVPAERRAAVTVDALARSLGPGQVVPSGLRAAELLRTVGWDPSADYLVVRDEDVVGVLRGADVTRLLESQGLVSRRTAR